MWQFGNDKREHGVNYVGTSLYQCVQPWLSMLSMYQAMGRQREFEVIARRLHDDFNLGIILWHADDEMPAPGDQGCLEAYPHIIEHISACWRRRECLEYVNDLLEDNRAGVRRGFTLGAFAELLLLAELLEAGLMQRQPPPQEDKAEVPATPIASRLYRLALTGTLALLNRLHLYYPKRPSMGA